MFIKDVNKNEILLPVIFSGNALKIATFINSTRGILKTVKIDFYKPKKKNNFVLPPKNRFCANLPNIEISFQCCDVC